MTDPEPQVTGLVLAGGRARRLGGVDKGLVELAGRPLIARVLEVLAPQVDTLIINANRNQDRYRQWGYLVIADRSGDFSGPLAGMAAGLHVCRTPLLVTAPCDCPFLPADLVRRLYERLRAERAQLAVAHNGERLQPVFTLLERSLLPSIERFLEEGERKIDLWFERHRVAIADFSDIPDTFININTPEDIAAVEARLGKQDLPA
jgi:molybdenum cofactor guanylyltransferase